MNGMPINYRAVLADIEARIQKLQTAAEAIREILTITEPGVTAMSGINGQSLTPDTFHGLSIGDAAKKYLGIMKRKLSIKEITDGLEQANYPHTSSNFLNTVRTALNREVNKKDAEVVKLPDGDYGLVVWYPGLRSKQSRFGAQDNENTRSEQQSKDNDDFDPVAEEKAAYNKEQDQLLKDML